MQNLVALLAPAALITLVCATLLMRGCQTRIRFKVQSIILLLLFVFNQYTRFDNIRSWLTSIKWKIASFSKREKTQYSYFNKTPLSQFDRCVRDGTLH